MPGKEENQPQQSNTATTARERKKGKEGKQIHAQWLEQSRVTREEKCQGTSLHSLKSDCTHLMRFSEERR